MKCPKTVLDLWIRKARRGQEDGDHEGLVSWVDTQAGKAGGGPNSKGWPATLGIWGAKGASEFLSRGMMRVTKPVAHGKGGLKGSEQGLGAC